MAIDLVFKVPVFLRNLNGIQKSARHLNFDFEILTFELCFDGMVHGCRSSAPERKLITKCQQQNSQLHFVKALFSSPSKFLKSSGTLKTRSFAIDL